MRSDAFDSINIVALMQVTGVKLYPSNGTYQALCPLHRDKDTPSLRVYPHNNSWCCFGAGCGNKVGKINGGRQLEWVKQKFSCSYRDAEAWLRANFGLLQDAPKLPNLQKHIAKPKPVAPQMVAYWHGLMDECERRPWFHKRGFTDATIDKEWFGWDGRRYVIPVWDYAPGFSECLGVRLRKSEVCEDGAMKYVGLGGHNVPTVWGKQYCKGHKLALAFAGELDAARAVQDGMAAMSMVNGVNAYSRFPPDWPDMWFPDTKYLVVVFDKKEEVQGAGLAREWNKTKGTMAARVFHWPPGLNVKDYCEFRDSGETVDKFKQLVALEMGAAVALAKAA